MEDQRRSAMLATVRAHCARPGSAVLFDEVGRALLDVRSGKVLPFLPAQLQEVTEAVDQQTSNPYLRLQLGDGLALALTEAGIAFPPDFANSGPLPELPQAVCWSDFASLEGRLRHELYGHPDEEPTRGTAKLLMMCIAILDGARAAGFEVGPEEQRLEGHLKELERRAPGGGG